MVSIALPLLTDVAVTYSNRLFEPPFDWSATHTWPV